VPRGAGTSSTPRVLKPAHDLDAPHRTAISLGKSGAGAAPRAVAGCPGRPLSLSWPDGRPGREGHEHPGPPARHRRRPRYTRGGRRGARDLGGGVPRAWSRRPRRQLARPPAGGDAAAPHPPPSSASAPQPSPTGDAAEPPPSSTTASLGLLDDAQLVLLGARGQQKALEVLYRRHSAFAIHLATRIEGSSRDVEDVAHDAFLKAFTHLGDLADPRSFRSWLGSIVVHAVRSRMRRTRLMNVLGITNLFGRAAEPVDLDAVASSDASPLVRAQLAQIYALLRTLPTDDRIAWTLRAIEGHDLETVARLAGCSLATAKRRISRAQKTLDELFIAPQGDHGITEAGSAARDAAPAPVVPEPAAHAGDEAPPRNRR
jgi:RNA polymerase sigma-70 factor (ECF subfamily)